VIQLRWIKGFFATNPKSDREWVLESYLCAEKWSPCIEFHKSISGGHTMSFAGGGRVNPKPYLFTLKELSNLKNLRAEPDIYRIIHEQTGNELPIEFIQE